MDHRLQALNAWLNTTLKTSITLTAMPGDASFRRYFRFQQDSDSYIAVDAPPETEDSRSFVTVASLLSESGVTVPEVLASDLENGFLIVSDLGDNVYLKTLQSHNADTLYTKALLSLHKIQKTSLTNVMLPAFDHDFMLQELNNFQHWFLEKYLNITLSPALLANTFQYLITSAQSQPYLCVHRDYHSRNLMLMETGQVGVLDFQDAVKGPVTYDLVSLLRDCYIDWPQEQVRQWCLQYYTQLHRQGMLQDGSFEQFMTWFDLMGVQRHLKALFIFTRKYLRDGASNYLAYLPRTFGYVMQVLPHYPELTDFYEAMRTQVAPRLDTGIV